MKSINVIFLSFLMMISTYASNDEVIGLKKLTSLIAENTPHTLENKKVKLSVKSEVEYDLKLIPEENFSILNTGHNVFDVTFINTRSLYLDIGGLWIPVKDSINYELIKVGEVDIDTRSDSFSSCLIDVGFKYSNQAIDFDKISKYYDVDFKFNKRIVEMRDIRGTSVTFKRLNNSDTKVELVLTPYDANLPLIEIVSNSLATCSQPTDEPVSEPEPVLLPEWSEWTKWGSCSNKCGGGLQSRVRQCLNRKYGECEGRDMETRSCNTHSCNPPVVRNDFDIDKYFMRYKSINVDILNASKPSVISRKFEATFRAVVKNPYPGIIKCNVYIQSARGENEDHQVIDTKVFRDVLIDANSSSELTGEINCRAGKGSQGLEWVYNYGYDVKVTGCTKV